MFKTVGESLSLRYARLSSNLKQFLSNFLWHFFSKIGNKLPKFFVLLVAARLIGPNGWGVYSYMLSLVTIGFTVSDWGMGLLLIRDYSRKQLEDKSTIFPTFLFGKIIILLLSSLVSLGIIWLVGATSNLLVGNIIILTLFFESITTLFHNLFIAEQDTKKEFYSTLIDGGILLMAFILFFYWPSTTSLSFSFFMASLAGFLSSVFLSRRLIKIASLVRCFFSKIDWVYLRKIFIQGLYLSLFGISSYLFFSTDQLLIKHFLGFEAVGLYALASRLILFSAILPPLINAVLLPQLSLNSEDRNRIKKYTIISFALLFVAGLLLCVAFIALSPWIVTTFFGPKFSASIPVLKILAWMVVPLFAVSILDYLLVVYNKQLQNFILTLAAAVINLFLNILLVPKLGIVGAAISSVVGQYLNLLFTLLLVLYFSRRRLNFNLKYTIGYIDLQVDSQTLWDNLDCRTEIKKAQKSGIEIILADNQARHEDASQCRKLLSQLLRRELIPYSKGYDALIDDPGNFLFLAKKNNRVVSFISVLPNSKNDFFSSTKTAFLGLSATDDENKKLCPNYLLIWEAVQYLQRKGFEVFNLGLLEYLDCPDTATSKVAFFKRKWNITEVVMVEEGASFVKWFYYRFLKRFATIRKALYLFKKYI